MGKYMIPSLALVFAFGGAEAQDTLDGKVVEPGFDPEQVYRVGDFDDINLFNGNLTISLPIGPEYPIRQGFSYQFQITYNSKIWRFVSCPSSDFRCDVDPARETTDVPLKAGNTEGIPNPRNNAGAGWRFTLGFGELYGPTPEDSEGDFVYVEPSGSEHSFSVPEFDLDQEDSRFIYPQYSFDGQRMLRIMVTDPQTKEAEIAKQPVEAEVHLPDGKVLTYQRPPRGQVPNGRWELVRVEDPFDNAITIKEDSKVVEFDYDQDGNPESVRVPDLWTVTDDFRRHTIHFDNFGKLSKIELAGFDGTTSKYQLAYERTDKIRPGCPSDRRDKDTGELFFQPELDLLTAVELPDGKSSFEFTYHPPGSEDGPACSSEDGRLAKMTLPTKGSIEYDYGIYAFPTPLACEEIKPLPNVPEQFDTHFATLVMGVNRKIVRDRDGSVLGRWEYQSSPAGWGGTTDLLPGSGSCQIGDVAYTDVYTPIQGDLFRLTRHFFSAFKHGVDEAALGFSRNEYGLSLDRFSPDPNGRERYRSSMEFECRGVPENNDGFLIPNYIDVPGWPNDRLHLLIPEQCRNLDNKGIGESFDSPSEVHGIRDRYVRYEAGNKYLCDGIESRLGDCDASHWRVASERTYFWDDCEAREANGDCKSPRFRTVDRFQPDGFGNFRKIRRTAHFGFPVTQEPLRRVTTDFNSHLFGLPSLTKPWILNTYTQRQVSQEQVEGEPNAVATEDYIFDRAKGVLLSKRTRRASSERSTDLRVDRDYSIRGNVEEIRHSGGITGGAHSGSPAAYRQVNHHCSGVVARSEFVDSNGSTVLRTADAIDGHVANCDASTIDPNTGLPKATWDAAGVKDEYTYDALWRITRIEPQSVGNEKPAEAATVYDYQAATDTSPAQVRVKRMAGGTLLMQTEFTFDGLGRIVRRERLIPDGRTSAQWMTYTAQGEIEEQSTVFEDGQGADGVTSFEYDVFNRVHRIRSPDGKDGDGRFVTRLDYEGDRRTKRTIKDVGTAAGESNDMVTVFLNNGHGELVSVKHRILEADGTSTEMDGLRTDYEYDEGGRLATVMQWDANGNDQRREFDYDGAGLLTRESHPELGVDVLYDRYDALGNMGRKRLGIEGSEFDLSFSFDRAGRLISVNEARTGRRLAEFYFNQFYGNASYKDPSMGGPALGNGKLYQSKRHHYDAGISDTVVTQTNFYGGVGGRLSRQSIRTGGSGVPPRVYFRTGDEVVDGYTYGPLGVMRGFRYPRCAQAGCGRFELASDFDARIVDESAPNRTILSDYERGLLSGVRDRVGGLFRDVAEFDYHPNQLLAEITHHNDTLVDGSIDHTGDIFDVIANDPDGLTRPKRISAQGSDLSTLWTTGDYSYDGAGNVIGIGADSYVYEPVFGRLAHALVDGKARTYRYDAFGNLTDIGTDGQHNSRTIQPSPSTNRMTSSLYTYDIAGNLERADKWVYDYGPANTLREVRNDSITTAVGLEYLYTADNERIAILDKVNARERWTVRDPDNQVVREYEFNGGAWSWDLDYVRRHGRLVAAFVNGDSAPGDIRHYSLDHLGTPRLITRENAVLNSRHDYFPYGEEITPQVGVGRLQFTGHERDDLDKGEQEFDLDYMHARYYGQHFGRFLSVDPVRGEVENPISWNRYSYVNGRPLTLMDPAGREGEEYYRYCGDSGECVDIQDAIEVVGLMEAIDLFAESSQIDLQPQIEPIAAHESIPFQPGCPQRTRCHVSDQSPDAIPPETMLSGMSMPLLGSVGLLPRSLGAGAVMRTIGAGRNAEVFLGLGGWTIGRQLGVMGGLFLRGLALGPVRAGTGGFWTSAEAISLVAGRAATTAVVMEKARSSYGANPQENIEQRPARLIPLEQ